MTGEMPIHSLGQKAFTATLAAAGQSGASTFRAHAGAEPVLLLSGSFGALQCAFHKRTRARRDGAGMLRRFSVLSIGAERRSTDRNDNCQRSPFLE
jgi:hypothetical protein